MAGTVGAAWGWADTFIENNIKNTYTQNQHTQRAACHALRPRAHLQRPKRRSRESLPDVCQCLLHRRRKRTCIISRDALFAYLDKPHLRAARSSASGKAYANTALGCCCRDAPRRRAARAHVRTPAFAVRTQAAAAASCRCEVHDTASATRLSSQRRFYAPDVA